MPHNNVLVKTLHELKCELIKALKYIIKTFYTESD